MLSITNDADVMLAYALKNGYQVNIVTAAQPATLSYDSKGVPISVAAVPASSVPNPQTPEQFVTNALSKDLIAIYQDKYIADATAAAQAAQAAAIAAAIAAAQTAVAAKIALLP